MKKAAVLLPIAALILLASLSAYSSIGNSLTQGRERSVVSESGYTVKAENGYLAIYRNGENEPFDFSEERITPDIPEEELLQLIKGLHADDESGLQSIIEAYTS